MLHHAIKAETLKEIDPFDMLNTSVSSGLRFFFNYPKKDIMNKVALILSLFLLNEANAQNAPEQRYDFWLGSWDLTWVESNGEIERGKNRITTILDGKVIQEDFEATEGSQKGYKGTSISVYNPQTSTWHQTWMDNQQGNIVFEGAFVGSNPTFMTKPQEVNGTTLVSRMVFKNITNNAFTWDWESSQDGGATWKLNWQISYKRSK